ncbi:5990_t:CDS:2 [Acaulospora morrowiae]|uniref:5990_t:CDS:1 n=1 Tax=Acaulospora morrowiae TaxID=94023 RepID=A0A9N8ZIP7_9GLOM|nr:5990_t:CDS:2 [Acaulospora morrowiae]
MPNTFQGIVQSIITIPNNPRKKATTLHEANGKELILTFMGRQCMNQHATGDTTDNKKTKKKFHRFCKNRLIFKK